MNSRLDQIASELDMTYERIIDLENQLEQAIESRDSILNIASTLLDGFENKTKKEWRSIIIDRSEND